MSAAFLLLLLDLALVVGAAIFLLLVVLQRGRLGTNLGLALLLIVLAATVWYTAVRAPPPHP